MSALLTEPENAAIRQTLTGQTEFCRAIVSVFQAPPSLPDEWVRTGRLGVLAVVYDPAVRGAALRVLHPATGTPLLEQPLYRDFEYTAPERCFHTYEAEGFVVGLAFPVDYPEEADRVLATVRQYAGKQTCVWTAGLRSACAVGLFMPGQSCFVLTHDVARCCFFFFGGGGIRFGG
jgi:hypothetical protein